MSKRWRKVMWSVFAVLMFCNLFIAGCQSGFNAETGKWEWRINPEVVDNVEKGMEGGIGIFEILTPFIGPIGGLATGTLATALGLLRRFKPQLTEFKTRAELSHAVATIGIETIEELKVRHPKAWADMEEGVRKLCRDNDIPTTEIKNAIRGLRGLPLKSDIKTLWVKS